MVLGIEALHEIGIMHRDIKPANILVDKEGNLKLTDYGLSELKKNVSVQGLFSKKGSLNFMAPEIFLPSTHELSFGVDWYALGVLIFDIIKERLPIDGDTPEETVYNILHPKIVWDEPEELEDEDYCFSPELKDLVQRLIEPDPKLRLGSKDGASEIKNHPYFTQKNPKNWAMVKNKQYYVYKPVKEFNSKKYISGNLALKNMKDFIE